MNIRRSLPYVCQQMYRTILRRLVYFELLKVILMYQIFFLRPLLALCLYCGSTPVRLLVREATTIPKNIQASGLTKLIPQPSPQVLASSLSSRVASTNNRLIESSLVFVTACCQTLAKTVDNVDRDRRAQPRQKSSRVLQQ